jgi:predicted ATPase/DNA-binding SARP family transcriptional activator
MEGMIMARLSLFLFGGFEARLDETSISGFKTEKARALLAYLAVEQGHPHRRQALAGLFWPGYLERSARANLRHALANLRQVLMDDQADPLFLLIDGETIQLNREADVWVDVWEFEQGIASKDQGTDSRDLHSSSINLQSTTDLYLGSFLEGFSLKDCPEFDTWTGIVREGLQGEALAAFSCLAGEYERQGALETACQYARKQLALDPTREEAHRQVMRILARSGGRTAALLQYETCKRSLAEQLGVEPSIETTRLFEQIRTEKEESISNATQAGRVPTEPASRIMPSPRSKHNLPVQLTSFIGREKEIEAVAHLLHTNRLVTLTGPGGTGKTRLALQTAAGLVEQFADGVWLVELATISDPGLVPALAARALGLRELTGPQAIALLQEYLEGRHLLLVLDNCEHVIDACIRLAVALLQTCPKLTILSSSREGLGIAGEVLFRVPSLTLPEAGMVPPFEALAQYEAIRLFVERAATISPGFALTSANTPAILRICQRLDGIPLAIELAAARTRLLQVTEIAQRLDDRFRLLTGGSRASLPRHQTLRASIDWSYDLLSDPERALLQRLSVFAGGWILEAAEFLGCDGHQSPHGRVGDDIQSYEVLELLGLLVDKSLVNTRSGPDGATWYRMLETINQYAHDKLVETGQIDAVRDRHLQYYIELAERIEENIRGPNEAQILDQLEAELDNLRLALAWSLEGRGKPGWDPEPGIRLASALKWFWQFRGRQDEAIQWLEQLLAGEKKERADRPLTLERGLCRAKALFVAAYLAGAINEISKARQYSTESRELYQSLGPDGKVGYAYVVLFSINQEKSPIESICLTKECQTIFQEANDQFGLVECLRVRGQIARQQKEYESARALYEEFMVLRKENNDLDGIASALYLLGELAYEQGKMEQARALFEESQKAFSDLHNASMEGIIFIKLSDIDKFEGKYAQATNHVKEALSIGHRQGEINVIHGGLLILGCLAMHQGNIQAATERFEECLSYFRKKDHKAYISDTLYNLGLLAWIRGELEQAYWLYTEAMNTSKDLNTWEGAPVLIGLGRVCLARGETRQAIEYFKQALGIPNPSVNTLNISLDGMAILEAARGQYESAARLLGASNLYFTKYHYTLYLRHLQEREAFIASLRAAMGEQVYAAAFAEGQAMTQEQAVQAAKDAIKYNDDPSSAVD